MLRYVPKTYICSCCGQEKFEYEFYRQSYTGQLEKQCKTCINVKRSVQRHKAKYGKFISKEKQRSMTQDIKYFLTDWKDAMIHFGGGCAWCDTKEGRARKSKHERDHVIPVSKGGKTIRNNIVPSCAKCNSRYVFCFG